MGEATIGFLDFEAFGFDERLVDDVADASGSTLETSNEGFWINKPALFGISVSCEYVDADDKCKYAQWI